jgi:hypothetical protein
MKILIPAAAATLLCTASVSLAQGPQERPERGGGQERSARPDAGNRGGGEMRGRAERAEPRAQRAEPRVQRETPRVDRAERADRSRERVQRSERSDRQASERRDRRDASRERESRRENRAEERRQGDRRQVERRRDRDERTVERQKDRAQAQDRRNSGDRQRAEGRGDQNRREVIREARTRFSADQRQRFRSSFNRRHVTNVRFSARIGTRVPRSVRLYAIPAAVIGLVPAYSYYRYVYVDDTICIVDPATYEVVDVIEYGSDTPTVVEARLDLTAAERALLLDSISADFPETDVSLRLALGADVPDRVELHTFPEIVIDRIPKLRGHRFVVSDGDVVIVGARSREIQLVVRR